jgi:uncharacterized repeat protein (TIGR01451 family)
MSAAAKTTDRTSTGRKEQIAMRQSKGRKLTGAFARRMGIGTATLGLLLAAMIAIAAPPALAGTPEWSVYAGTPDTVEPGEEIRYSLAVANTGTAPFTGTFTVTHILPAGIVPTEAQEGACTISGQEVTCDIAVTDFLPAAQWSEFFRATVDPGASGTGTSVIKVEGNGAGPDFQVEETVTFGPPRPFELDSFVASPSRAGNPETQAGAAPEIQDTRFSLYSSIFRALGFFPIGVKATEHMRTVIVHAPPGVVANLNATPVRCTAAQLTEQEEGTQMSKCPADSQIGTIRLIGKRLIVPLYNMVTPPGVPAVFGFEFLSVAVITEAHLRPSDFGFDLVTRGVNSSVPLADIDYTLWGVPADSSHDSSRGLCFDLANGNTKIHEPSGLCPSNAPRKAFLRLPTSCSGQPLDWSMEVDSYEHPGTFKTAQMTTPPQVGCNQLEFTPSLKAKPTTNVGDSPAGLEFALHIPQNEDPDGLAEAHLKNLRAVLPEGLNLNPASADGLGSCSPQQIGLLTAVGQLPAKFDGEHAHCPDSSKLGSLSVYSPAVGGTLPGLVYLAAPHENPFGSLIALYLAIDDPHTGILVKVPVQVELDPNTGQITTLVDDSVPLPFEDFEVELDQGPHAALRTPVSCGSFSTSSDLTPWSSPEGQDAHPSDSFEIVKGAGGGACVSSEGAAQGTPAFEAGTLEPRAGAYSPVVLKVTRQDGSQQITGIDATLPKGLVARLAYTSYCPEPALAAAESKSGRAEEAEPSCPTSSQVGAVQIASGAGPAPLHSQGNVYLTGPYKGGPIGLAIITPAVAGPFDLGNVVVRTAIRTDRETAQVRAVSDPIPHILQGIPLDLRQVKVLVDRPQYTLNPTSCDPMSVTGSISLLSGQFAAVSNPFQVGGCTNLSFKPKLSVRLKGGTTRTKHPALTTTLTFPKGGGANVARASVALPHSEFLDQSNIRTICTRAQFAADACPAQSVYGSARAMTPLLDRPLDGKVYLRSSSHKLPDLVVALRGQIEVDLVGQIDTLNGGIRATFASVPDAPVSRFTLKMVGGEKGLLQNSTNLCRGRHRAIVVFDGQNGKTADQQPVIKAHCPSSRHRNVRHR